MKNCFCADITNVIFAGKYGGNEYLRTTTGEAYFPALKPSQNNKTLLLTSR